MVQELTVFILKEEQRERPGSGTETITDQLTVVIPSLLTGRRAATSGVSPLDNPLERAADTAFDSRQSPGQEPITIDGLVDTFNL